MLLFVKQGGGGTARPIVVNFRIGFGRGSIVVVIVLLGEIVVVFQRCLVVVFGGVGGCCFVKGIIGTGMRKSRK